MPLLNPTHINDVLQSILDVACNCLEEDSVLGRPADCYISHGRPPGDCCFAAETRVVTSEGVRPIGEMAGSEVELMTTDGKWVKAPIKSFGVQPLRRVVLSRMREEKVIYATGNHRWLLDDRATTNYKRSLRECLTDDLQAGDILALEGGERPDVEIDPEGVRAGIVFGDGSADQWSCRVTLYGPKADLVSWFDGDHLGSPDKRYPGSVSVRRLPNTWKNLPDPSGDLSYLLGWLVGYVATDGSVSDKTSSVRLGSSVQEHLEVVRDICYRLGIVTSKISTQMRRGFNDYETPLFSLSFSTATLPEGFLIRPDQATRFRPGRSSPARWRVVEVSETERIEEVFCATVEDTHSFVLEDNILTGNCDVLAIWLERIRPRTGFENAQYTTGEKVWAKCGDVGGVADIALQLWRDCYPVVKDNASNPFPTAEEMQAASEDLLIDVQVLRCCIAQALCEGTLFPDDVQCLEFAIGDITPEGPKGGCAGWTLRFAFEMESCEYGSASS